MENKKNLQKKIGEIGQNFLLKLKENLASLEDFVKLLEAGKTSSEKQEEIRGQMHKIAGSAKIFGFEELGNLAASIENKLSGKARKAAQKDCKTFLNKAQILIDSKLETQKEIHSEAIGQKKHRYSIVIADDDELILDLVRHALSDVDCDLIETKNGVDFLNKIAELEKLPDLAILDVELDVKMPKKNGFEVLKTLRSHAKTKEIPVIMLSQKADESDVVKGISSGAMDYITKPFEVDFFKNRVLEIIQNFRKKILIADDDDTIHEVLSGHFHRVGYTVFNAKSGKETLKIILAEKPDIVLLDYMMPVMDGVAVLKKIKSDEATANIPVIMLTAKSQQVNVLQGLKSGADDYVTKPFDIEELLQRVEGILTRAKHA